jgi:tRNA dimethylallyltransferase
VTDHLQQHNAHGPVLVIGGPTASGKSALALAAAIQFNGVVINGDSMQVYDVLDVLTARPQAADLAAAPHRLYGCLSPHVACSMAQWLDLAQAEIRAAWAAGQLPIVCGGTGLYLRALLYGVSPVPEIPAAIRADIREKVQEMQGEEAHRWLQAEDPAMAARLQPGDRQRIARALEVMRATGVSLALWQEKPDVPVLPNARFGMAILQPDRDWLNARIHRRFDMMLDMGALAEVQALCAARVAPEKPAMKALGVPELAAHLRGERDLDSAIADAKTATRRFAKRQNTWFRNQFKQEYGMILKYYNSKQDKIFAEICEPLLTHGR